MWNHSACVCDCNTACGSDEYVDTKIYLCKKRLFDKLVLACEDEILNTTETSFDDKKQHLQKIIALFTLFYL